MHLVLRARFLTRDVLGLSQQALSCLVSIGGCFKHSLLHQSNGLAGNVRFGLLENVGALLRSRHVLHRIGLLCRDELPDRPTLTSVLLMRVEAFF